MQQILVLAIVVGLTLYLANQVRKPTKRVGRLFAWSMNSSHSSLTDWGLEKVSIEKNFAILDVGCGGGRTIQKLAAIASEGKVYGVDYAKGSVAASSSKNAELIKAGRVEIMQGSVSELPFPDDSFDLITAVETHYYWTNLEKDLQEVRRVLKPHGILILIAEDFKGRRFDKVIGIATKILRYKRLSLDEHRELLSTAGYTDVRLFVDENKGWVCCSGKKGEISHGNSPEAQ